MSEVIDLRYPKAKYHKTLPVAQVANAREESELGEGWFDHPSLKNKPVFLQSGDVIEAEVLEGETKPIIVDQQAVVKARLISRPVGRPKKIEEPVL